MNKTLWAILVGAMLTPIDSDFMKHKSNETKQEISEVLSIDAESEPQNVLKPFLQEWQEFHQQHIENLIPQIKEPIILWDLKQPNVAITIDDGYGKESLEYMLDLFEKNDVKATFFVIWECLKLYPALWQRAVEQWHEICNHTQTHSKYFKTWNESERFEKELLWWERIVKDVLWEEYFLDILKKHGYIPIWWRHTKNPDSWNINNGDIFLWHFKNADTLNVRKNLEMILSEWKHPKTVSDIITSENYTEPIWWHNVYKKKNGVKWQ